MTTDNALFEQIADTVCEFARRYIQTFEDEDLAEREKILHQLQTAGLHPAHVEKMVSALDDVGAKAVPRSSYDLQ